MRNALLSAKNKLIATVKRIPSYGWFFSAACIALQYGLYRLGDWLSRIIGTRSYAVIPKIPAIDDAIPAIPIFVLIYMFSYVFWVCGTLVASLTKKKNFINYIIWYTAAYVVGFFFFIFMPTKMDRVAEGLTEIQNPLLRFIYFTDGGNEGFDLFPSYHCLTSLCCYLSVRKQPEIPKGYRIYAIVMTVLICLSTLFTKQHYILDVIGGLLIPLLCYIAVEKLDPASKILAKNPNPALFTDKRKK